MKYKVGDKVKIKEDLSDTSTVKAMCKYQGRIATVVDNVGLYVYTLDIDNGMWSWFVDALEPVEGKSYRLKEPLDLSDDGDESMMVHEATVSEDGDWKYEISGNFVADQTLKFLFKNHRDEYFEEVKPKRWRAEEEDDYYFIGRNGNLVVDVDVRDPFDDEYYEVDNYWKTKEHAEEVAKEMKELFEKKAKEFGYYE